MLIADRCAVSIHYTLTDDAGDVLDSSAGREPLTYLHGAGQIVPGLEHALDGRAAGDVFSIYIAPEDGYGPRIDSMVQVVPRAAFQGVARLEPGMQFEASGDQGTLSVVITAIDGDSVTVDGNHPLAGQVLHFDVEVTAVRAASVEEVQHGHVHGAGGHAH